MFSVMGRIFSQIVSDSRLKFFSFGEKMLAGLLGLYCKCSKDKFYKKLILWKNAIFVVKRNFSQRFWTSGEKTQQAYDHFILSSRWSFYGDSCHKVKKTFVNMFWLRVRIHRNFGETIFSRVVRFLLHVWIWKFATEYFHVKRIFFHSYFLIRGESFLSFGEKNAGCFKFFLSVQKIELTKDEFFEDWYVLCIGLRAKIFQLLRKSKWHGYQNCLFIVPCYILRKNSFWEEKESFIKFWGFVEKNTAVLSKLQFIVPRNFLKT